MSAPGKPDVQGQDLRDLGFGSRVESNHARLINPNGSLNVIKKGGGLGAFHLYQFLITTSWWKFLLYVFLFFVLTNTFFASLYLIAGAEGLSGAPTGNGLSLFAHAFYFSVQTFTTVGYGAISPLNDANSLISSFEAMVGLMGFALVTGVLYGRFARPSAKIRFSQKALIAPYKDINGLMCRIVNRRRNQLIELSASVFLSRYEWVENDVKQRFYPLQLERDKIAMFPLNWTLVHPIDENSPIYGLTIDQMKAQSTEILIIIKAYDDTFAQLVHARCSYRVEDMLVGKKFLPMYHTDESGKIILEIDCIDKMEDAPLNNSPKF